MKVTVEVIGWARAAVGLLCAGALPGDFATRLSAEIARYADLGDRVVDQTKRRVLDKEKVPAVQKVLSIFQPHTDIIIKDRRETLFGHKLLLGTGVRGVVQFCTVLRGNPADSTLVGQSLDSVIAAVGRVPRQAALDGGFASVANLKLAKAKGHQGHLLLQTSRDEGGRHGQERLGLQEALALPCRSRGGNLLAQAVLWPWTMQLEG